MNKYSKLLSDTVLFAVSSFASKLLVFIMLPFYTNILSTTDYAIADLITTTISLVIPVLTFSVSDAALRFSFEENIKKGSILSIVIAIVVTSTVLLIVVSPIVSVFSVTLSDYWFFFVVIYFVRVLQNCFSYYMRGCNRVRVFALQGIVQTLFSVVFNILLLAVFKQGLEGYLWATILSFTASVIYTTIAGRIPQDLGRFKIDMGVAKQILKYSIPLIPTTIAWWVMETSDKYMIIWKLGLSDSGIYSVSYKIPTILAVIASLFTQAWQISAFSNYGKKDNEKFVSTVYNYFHFISVISCGVLILLSKLLGKILFAKDYFVAWTYVPILLIAYVFSGLAAFLDANFASSKKTYALFWATSVGAIVNIVLNLIFIDRMGVLGAAYTTMVGFIVTWAMRYWMSRKLVAMQVPLMKHILMYVFLIIEAVCIYKEVPFRYGIGLVIVIVLVLLNWKEMTSLLGYAKELLCASFKK